MFAKVPQKGNGTALWQKLGPITYDFLQARYPAGIPAGSEYKEQKLENGDFC